MPSHLQDLAEQRHTDGLTLREVAALAASIQDLVHAEALARLQLTGEIHRHNLSDFSWPDLEEMVSTYFHCVPLGRQPHSRHSSRSCDCQGGVEGVCFRGGCKYGLDEGARE